MKTFLLLLFAISGAPYSFGQEINPRHIVVPSYPNIARNARVEGSVVLQLEIGSDGQVTSVKTIGPSRMLNEKSAENVKQWVFAGNVPGKLTITYVYKLVGQETYYSPPPLVILDLPSRVQISSSPPEPMP